MGTYNTHSVNAQFTLTIHDDVVKWKHFPHYWPFVREIHRSPVKSPHKGQWRGTLMLSLSCAWINDWMNNREAGDLTRHHAHYDVNVMFEHGFGCVSLWFDSCRLYPNHSGCLRWHWGNHMISPVPVNQGWRIWVNLLYKSTNKYDITRHKPTKECEYFTGHRAMELAHLAIRHPPPPPNPPPPPPGIFKSIYFNENFRI